VFERRTSRLPQLGQRLCMGDYRRVVGMSASKLRARRSAAMPRCRRQISIGTSAVRDIAAGHRRNAFDRRNRAAPMRIIAKRNAPAMAAGQGAADRTESRGIRARRRSRGAVAFPGALLLPDRSHLRLQEVKRRRHPVDARMTSARPPVKFIRCRTG
jgi:hypothetical protein